MRGKPGATRWAACGTRSVCFNFDTSANKAFVQNIACSTWAVAACGGVHFIRYLDSGCYFGVDRDATLLDAGRRHELLPAEVAQRRPTFLCRDDFDFSALATDFDTALAQSVFTHLPWNSILRCLVRIQEVLKPGGRFFATFFEDPNGSHRIFPLAHQPGGIVTHADRDPYHYEFSVFQELARRVGMTVSNLGDWKHPRNQKMMVFQQPFRS